MAYSFSFDASMKFTQKSNVRGFLNHFARELNEVEIGHSNENIDKSKLRYNATYTYDAERGTMVLCKDHEQIIDAMLTRLDKAVDTENATYRNTGKKVRSDAVLAFGLIMQLDPELYKDNKTDSQLVNHSIDNMLHLAQEHFGKENIVAVSLHMDEANPHLHLLMTPVTEDGRLSQKDFINSPKLKQLHKDFRNELRDMGYDIDMHIKTPANAKRLSERDYKALQREQEELQQLEAEKRTLEAQKREFEAHRASQEQAFIEAEIEQNEREYTIGSISLMLDERESELKGLDNEITERAKEFVEALHNDMKIINDEKARLDTLSEQLDSTDTAKLQRAYAFAKQIKFTDGRTAYDKIMEEEKGWQENERAIARLDARWGDKSPYLQRTMAKIQRDIARGNTTHHKNDYDFDL